MTAGMQDRLLAAIRQVDEALAAHQSGSKGPLSQKLLANLRKELCEMLNSVDHRDYSPAYPRFLMDWPRDEAFIREMVTLAYDYKRKA